MAGGGRVVGFRNADGICYAQEFGLKDKETFFQAGSVEDGLSEDFRWVSSFSMWIL
jgi:hypothetical protein